MISPENLKKLAVLARIELASDEISRFAKDMNLILSYVGAVKAVYQERNKDESVGLVKNILREDRALRGPATYTKEVLGNAPHTSGDYIAVKKIIEGRDK
ncbi:MAG TPA: Asp-tRNA(Asn)/Glu-tRNA(Gln) amidotransferase subunit GatC [Candidatus Paceibacterota bacterium]